MSKRTLPSSASKLDLRKELKHLYQPSAREVTMVDMPVMRYLMVDGIGDPNTSQEYQQAVKALFSVAYALRFFVKRELAIEYSVMPLEGLWWSPDMRAFSVHHKEDWHWTMMIMQPQVVTPALYEQVTTQLHSKKAIPALAKPRLEDFHEGPAAQIMHLGPFATEAATITRLHAFLRAHGYGLAYKHHEIYLSDFRRVAPEKMRTVIRQPATVAR